MSNDCLRHSLYSSSDLIFFFHKDSHYSSYVQRKSFDMLCMFLMFSRVEIKGVWNKSRAAPLSDFRPGDASKFKPRSLT